MRRVFQTHAPLTAFKGGSGRQIFQAFFPVSLAHADQQVAELFQEQHATSTGSEAVPDFQYYKMMLARPVFQDNNPNERG